MYRELGLFVLLPVALVFIVACGIIGGEECEALNNVETEWRGNDSLLDGDWSRGLLDGDWSRDYPDGFRATGEEFWDREAGDYRWRLKMEKGLLRRDVYKFPDSFASRDELEAAADTWWCEQQPSVSGRGDS